LDRRFGFLPVSARPCVALEHPVLPIARLLTRAVLFAGATDAKVNLAANMAMPFLIINMGGEMVRLLGSVRFAFAERGCVSQLYILEQRLQAQSIVEEKSLRGAHLLLLRCVS
jgi:hypothetical protein